MSVTPSSSLSIGATDATAPRPGAWGWAVYLGMSWTWVIGMFLPVLLVRELGFWGWVIFAVPNVVGAAAMGWVLRSEGVSRRIVDEHADACLAFSLVTFCFHGFFLMWIVLRVLGSFTAVPYLAAFVLFGFLRTRSRSAPAIATGIFVLSLVAWLYAGGVTGELAFPPVTRPPDVTGLLALAPVCVFGFLFCPYLDLTFHRARQQTDARGARVAFGAGFGLFFFSMIVFSLTYATRLAPLVDLPGRIVRSPALVAVALHVAVQSAFTQFVHFEESLRAVPPARRNWRSAFVAGLALSVAAGWIGDVVGANGSRWFGLDPGEVVYRAFMGFYGLVFPAYVWICMVPKFDPRKQFMLFVAAVLVALPFYFVGFILRHMVWLLPGVAVPVLAGAYLVMRSRKGTAA